LQCPFLEQNFLEQTLVVLKVCEILEREK